MDVIYTVGLATGIPVTFISVGLSFTDPVYGFEDIISFLLAEEDPPQVFTTSYDWDEDPATFIFVYEYALSFSVLSK